MALERRSEQRYPISKEVALRDSSDRSEKPAIYLSRNISSKGIFVEIKGSRGFETGQLVHLEIDLGKLDDGGKPVQMRTKGRVVRNEEHGLAVLFNGRSRLVSI